MRSRIAKGLIVAAFCLWGFFSNCTQKQDIRIPDNTLNICNMHKISQGDEFVITHPLKLEYYKGKIYILDRRLSIILVFNESRYLYHIGLPGQGPGEIFRPISFDISGNELFVANTPGRIEVFDLEGIYIRTIKLNNKNLPFPILWDFKVHDRFLFFSTYTGNVKVQRYDLEGNFVDNFILIEEGEKSNDFLLSSPFKIYLDSGQNKLILFNQFNGTIEIYELSTGILLDLKKDYDSLVSGRASVVTKNVLNRKRNRNDIEVKVFIQMRSTFNSDKHQLFVVPSQNSRNNQERRKLLYTYNLDNEIIKKHFIEFEDVEVKYIRACTFVNKNIFFLSDSLCLYKGGIL